MQSLIGLLRRVRERLRSDSAAAPGAAGAPELREKDRDGLHGAAAGGDPAQLQRRWWQKKLRVKWRKAKKRIPKHLEEYTGSEIIGECSAGGTEDPAVLDSSCARTTADIALGTPAVTGADALPVAAAKQAKHDDSSSENKVLCLPEMHSEGSGELLESVLLPAADEESLYLQSISEDHSNGALAVAAAKQAKHDVSSSENKVLCLPEMHSEGSGELLESVLLPAADEQSLYLQSISEEHSNGALAVAAGKQAKHDDSPKNKVLCLPEMHSEGSGELLESVMLRAADEQSLYLQSISEEHSNGALEVAGPKAEEDDDSPFDSETESEGPKKVPSAAPLPAADGGRLLLQPVSEERTNGALEVAGPKAEEDDDSPFDSETESEGPKKVPSAAPLPAADGGRLLLQPVSEERTNGALEVAGPKAEEDDDSPFDSETESEGPKKVPSAAPLPAADGGRLLLQPVSEERTNGALEVAGPKAEEDDDSPFDSETESEGPKKVPSAAPLPAADGGRLLLQPVSEERTNGALEVAGPKAEEDDDSPFDSETESEGPKKVPSAAPLPAADGGRLLLQPVSEERTNGALEVAGPKAEEDDDSPFDSETESEGPKKVPSAAPLPAADGGRLLLQPVSEERTNGALEVAGPKAEEDDNSTSVNELLSLVERWVRQLQQELADALRKNSLAEASLEAKKRYCRDLQEQKLQLQKEVDRSKAKLQKLKEQHIQTKCYAESLKNAIKNKERELTASRNLQALLLMPSGTVAIPELEERIQRLQAGKARLEAAVQQQAKTIEALQKSLQASASAHNGLEDLRASFLATQTAKEHQHCQWGSESKELKQLAKRKCQSEALLDEMRGRNIALEAERTRLKMLLEGCRTKLMAYAGRVPAQYPGGDEEQLF